MISSEIGFLFLFISHIITLALFSRIIDKGINKKEKVYYLSKIATVKNIVKTNHQSHIFNDFNKEGNLEGININYQILLELITDDGCKKGYKKCGILDSIGNILCIDETFDCPINQLNVDLKSERNKYLNNDYKEIYNKNLIYNYQFYYSNKSIDNSIIVSILFSPIKPNYITISNFVIDIESYEDIIGVLPAFNEEDDKKSEINKGIQNIIIDVISNGEPLQTAIVKLVFSLLSFTSNKLKTKENIKNFRKYAEQRIKKEENIVDKYFINIGKNIYIKNYIGFKSLKDIETFMNFDYKKRYNEIFPSKNVIKVSIAFLILDIFFILVQSLFCYLYHSVIIPKIEKDKENNSLDNTKSEAGNQQNDKTNKQIMKDNLKIDNKIMEEAQEETGINEDLKIQKVNSDNDINQKNTNKNNVKNNNIFKEKAKTKNKKVCHKSSICYLISQFILFILFLLINLWILLFPIIKYLNINKIFIDLKNVKSDDFINSFINEFIKICCKKSSLYFASIIVSSISIFFHLIGIILIFISLCQK